MNLFVYPNEDDLRIFIGIITSEKYPISRYVPAVDKQWFQIIYDCITYVEGTNKYEPDSSFYDCCSRLLYKIAKRHELGDGNKRSAVIVVFIFCLLNDYMVVDPPLLKEQAKRAAKTKGRENEELIKDRISKKLSEEIKQSFSVNT